MSPFVGEHEAQRGYDLPTVACKEMAEPAVNLVKSTLKPTL